MPVALPGQKLPTPLTGPSPWRAALGMSSPLPQITLGARPGWPAIHFNAGFQQYNGKWAVVGTAKDEDTGAIIPGATIKLFDTATDAFLAQTTSDANGNFAFISGPGSPLQGSLSKPYYCIAYLPGSPDKAGITVNTIRAASAA